MINFCDCLGDGFCQRYQRAMVGRCREICAGINVDLGTAAAFREQWKREAGVQNSLDTIPQPLILKADQAAGDAVAMTAAIYSLHRAYPGKYQTMVLSKYPEVFQYNPDVVNVPSSIGLQEVRMHYPAVHQSNERGIHFMQGWCEFLGLALGINIPLLTNRPRLYFDGLGPPDSTMWLICSGGKQDFTTKRWNKYQEVVDLLKGKVSFVQVGDIADDHPRLSGVYDMVGKTTLRKLFNMVRAVRGVLCGVSLLMHVAAALEKPAVVIAGGREPVQWNAYPKQHYVHTIGALPCHDTLGNIGGACWRSRTIPLGDGMDQSICERPIYHKPVPECMTLIKPEEVANLILRYNQVTVRN